MLGDQQADAAVGFYQRADNQCARKRVEATSCSRCHVGPQIGPLLCLRMIKMNLNRWLVLGKVICYLAVEEICCREHPLSLNLLMDKTISAAHQL